MKMGKILEKIEQIFQMGKELRETQAPGDFSISDGARGEEEIIHTQEQRVVELNRYSNIKLKRALNDKLISNLFFINFFCLLIQFFRKKEYTDSMINLYDCKQVLQYFQASKFVMYTLVYWHKAL